MKYPLLNLVLIVAASIALSAQSTVLTNSTVLTGTTKMGAVNLAHTATVNMGGTVAADGVFSSGNANFGECSSLLTPNVVGSINVAANSIFFWPHAAGSGTYGTAIYTDSAGLAANLVPGSANVLTSSTPTNDAWNTIGPSAPLTLSPNTTYWLCQYASNAAWVQGINWNVAAGGGATCTNNDSTRAQNQTTTTSFSGLTSFPSTWPTSTSGTAGCFAEYVQLSYTSTATYDIVSWGGGGAVTSGSPCNPTCIYHIPPIGAGHTLLVASSAGGTGITLTGIVDNISGGSTKDTLTLRGAGAQNVTPGLTMQFSSIDRATAGVNEYVETYASGGHTGSMFVEVAGTASTSFDKSAYDSVAETTPYSSAATSSTCPTTVEFLLGAATTHASTIATFVGTGGWTSLFNGNQNGITQYGMGTLYKITSTCGTQNVTATDTSGAQVVVGLITNK